LPAKAKTAFYAASIGISVFYASHKEGVNDFRNASRKFIYGAIDLPFVEVTAIHCACSG
jgi:hypothetical protein